MKWQTGWLVGLLIRLQVVVVLVLSCLCLSLLLLLLATPLSVNKQKSRSQALSVCVCIEVYFFRYGLLETHRALQVSYHKSLQQCIVLRTLLSSCNSSPT